MTIYETIKAAICVKQAAEHYGLKVDLTSYEAAQKAGCGLWT